jgi:DNA-binding transcriptional LysR family regulator
MGTYIDLKKLEFVLAVARELHVGKAAERLKVAQSYVSRAIKQFEKEQELTVFVRNGRRIADLTPEGRAFVEWITPAFHNFQTQSARAGEVAEMILRKSAGTFMLGYSPLVPTAVLSEVRSVRSVRFPALRLQIRQLTPSEMSDLLSSGVLQAGLTYAFAARQDLDQIPLGGERLCAVYLRRPGTSANEEMHVEHLRTRPLYVLSSDRERPEIREWLLGQCALCGFTPKIGEEPASPREAFDLVLDAGGTAVMPEGMCVGAPSTLECSRISGLEDIQLVLTYHQNTSNRTQRIIREIANSLRHVHVQKAG